MDIVLANVSHLDFKIERDLIDQRGAVPLPFYGMDKSMAPVCQSLNTQSGTSCDKGISCPFRHIRGDRTIVCKHWLRGLCKKGDQCEFLHEYDMKKMPECYFYSRFNACHNKECPFLHIDPESKVKDCPWYDRGFCRHGPHCRHRHVRRVLCTNYLAGFCVAGWDCKFMHPRFELPAVMDSTKDQSGKKVPVCHYCGELGHKASNCRKNVDVDNDKKPTLEEDGLKKENHENSTLDNMQHHQQMDSQQGNASIHHQTHQPPQHHQQNANFPKTSKPLEEITCYKCGNKGHYANKCPKGHLAFLSNHRSHK